MADVIAVNADGGNGRGATACHFKITKARDGNAFGHGPFAPLAFHHRAKGREIGHTDRRFNFGPLFNELHHGFAALLHGNGRCAKRNHATRPDPKFRNGGLVTGSPIRSARIPAG